MGRTERGRRKERKKEGEKERERVRIIDAEFSRRLVDDKAGDAGLLGELLSWRLERSVSRTETIWHRKHHTGRGVM